MSGGSLGFFSGSSSFSSLFTIKWMQNSKEFYNWDGFFVKILVNLWYLEYHQMNVLLC